MDKSEINLHEITMARATRPDPYRRLAAAHELGHYFVCRWAGYDVRKPRIWGHGPDVAGETVVDREPPVRTTEEMRIYLLTYLAGPVAGERWGRRGSEVRQTRYMCRADNAAVRRAMRSLLARGLGPARLSRQAESLVQRYWPDITRLVPDLAKQGNL